MQKDYSTLFKSKHSVVRQDPQHTASTRKKGTATRAARISGMFKTGRLGILLAGGGGARLLTAGGLVSAVGGLLAGLLYAVLGFLSALANAVAGLLSLSLGLLPGRASLVLGLASLLLGGAGGLQ